jgi:hypothetical protein
MQGRNHHAGADENQVCGNERQGKRQNALHIGHSVSIGKATGTIDARKWQMRG